MKEEDNEVPPSWEHAVSILMAQRSTSELGKALRKWFNYQGFTSLFDFFVWNPQNMKHYKESLIYEIMDDGSTISLRSNQINQVMGLHAFMTHLVEESMEKGELDVVKPISEEQWSKTTMPQFRSYLVHHPQHVHTSTSSSPASTSVTNTHLLKLLAFKKGIKREVSAYPILKDEKHYDSFKRGLQITAKSHECQDILNPDFKPGSSPEEKELFEHKQIFMYSVFNINLLTDIGKTIVRKYQKTNDAQAVWKDLEDHMLHSSKGSSDKRRLTQYVTTTVLDNSYKGSTLQFVLHFNEQFRQLADISTTEEQLSPTLKLTLLQNAVRGIPDLRIVETMDEYLSTKGDSSTSTTLSYTKYYNLLTNACIRYDTSHKQNLAAKRNVYQASEGNYNDEDLDIYHDIHSDSWEGSQYGGIDLPSDTFYTLHKANQYKPQQSNSSQNIHGSNPKTKSNFKQYDGPIFLPSEIYQHLDTKARDALQKYNQARTNRKVNQSSVDTPSSESTEEPTISQDGEPELCISDDALQDLITGQPDNDSLEQVIQAYHSSQTPTNRAINFTYHISQTSHTKFGALVDRGANGGLAGNDVRILQKSGRTCTVTGIDNHELQGLPLVQCATLVETNLGKANLILNEYAYYGKGHTIHSSGQIEWFKNKVDDRSIKVGGQQCITTLDGYAIPLSCKSGLMYLPILGKPTDKDLETYPSIHLTSPHEWDPSVLDYEHSSELGTPSWHPNPTINSSFDPNFDELGHYTQRAISQLQSLIQDPIPTPDLHINSHDVTPAKLDYEKLRPYFGWVNADVVQKTIEQTTQWGTVVHNVPMRKHLKSRNPVLNVPRRQEAVATDTVYSDTPAVDCGVKLAQIFIGKQSLVSDVYPLKSGSHFINTLEDNIRIRGAMDLLISDSAKNEISNKVKDILRTYHIKDWQSEPYHQNQNLAENRYQTIKSWTNTIMNRTGASADTWLLCLKYVCFLLNHTACKALDYKIPLTVLTGSTVDTTILLQFTFHQPVYYATHDQSFPSTSEERPAYWVGFAEHVGDTMTYKLLDTSSRKIIYRAAVRPHTSASPNLRFPPFGGELPSSKQNENQEISPIKTIPTIFLKSRHDDDPNVRKPMPNFNPDDLLNRTFLLPPNEKGERFRAKITQKIIETLDKEDNERAEKINFLLDIGNGKAQEIISYNQILEHLENAKNEDTEISEYFKFRAITGHEGPLSPTDKNWKGSKYNVKVEWETGEVTYEPLSMIAADDPVTCAVYAKEHELLNKDGWKRFKHLVKNCKILHRAINQSKIRQARRSNVYMFGVLIPKNYKQAMEFDKMNSNTKWYDATKLEMDQIKEYQVFKTGEKARYDTQKKILNAPIGFNKIKVHLIFAVKHDGRYKARLVADGHLTPQPVESLYSGVVNLRNLRIIMFLSQLNDMKLWGADVGNAYLEAYTREKNFIIAGPEFEELEGHILIIDKALYGLKLSGKMWAEKFQEILRSMKFTPSKADPCIYMKKNEKEKCYEYIAVYVDDLCIAAKNPQEIIDALVKTHKLKLKGVGPLEFHLGCDYGVDPDGTFYSQPKKYIERMKQSYKRFFQEDPHKIHKSPLEKNDHPEMDTSEFAGEDMVEAYMSMIGQLQWLITLGRFDISAQVTSLSRFRAAPRIGHIERLKRICGYVFKTRHYGNRYRTEKPDYSYLGEQTYDWTQSIYGDVKEDIPEDTPEPLGKSVVTTTTMDANLNHCHATGRALTGCLHFINKTVTDWHSKLQATVETATYGAEFVAAKTAVEQIMDLRNTLRYLGVPITTKTYMFGDNKSVVTSSTIPHSLLNKRHNILAYHRVREAIAAKIIAFHWINSSSNLSDMLSKHWDHNSVYHQIQKLLETRGPIELIPRNATIEEIK